MRRRTGSRGFGEGRGWDGMRMGGGEGLEE